MTDPTSRSRRRAIVVGVATAAVVLLTLVAVVLVRHVAADREADGYHPLDISTGAAVWYGPDENSPDHLAGEFDTLHLAGPAGTEQRFLVPLYVDGAHDVRITAVTGRDLVARVEWSEYVFRNGGSVSGDKRPWHDFPVTVDAHQVIRLGIVLRKPAGCGAGLSRLWGSSLTVRWSALGRSHTDYLQAADDYTLYGCG